MFFSFYLLREGMKYLFARGPDEAVHVKRVKTGRRRTGQIFFFGFLSFLFFQLVFAQRFKVYVSFFKHPGPRTSACKGLFPALKSDRKLGHRSSVPAKQAETNYWGLILVPWSRTGTSDQFACSFWELLEGNLVLDQRSSDEGCFGHFQTRL